MESPERNPIVAVAEGQGSPLFNFLCSLSPIKLMKSVQTFSEISFPPPPTIFVTPRVDSQRDSSSLQRSQSKSKDLVPTQSGICQGSLQTENRRAVFNLGRSVQGFRKGRDQEEKGHALGSPCNSPCKLVEEYMVDEPMEAELKTVSSSRLPTVCELKASRRSLEDVLSARDLGRGNLLVEEEPAASPDVLYKLLEDDGLQEGRVSSGEDNTQVLQDSQLMESFKAVPLSSKGSIGDKEVTELDQETSDLMFLLSEGADKHPLPHVSLDDLQNQALSIQHMTGSLSSLSKIVNEEAQEIEMDCLAAQMTANTVASKSIDTSGDQQGGTASKVNFPVQRGFRRRCLDFEVLEGRWKSKRITSSLKAMHANVNTRSQSTPTCISDSSIHLTILKERTSATSGTTNSDSAQGLGACTETWVDTERTAQFNDTHVKTSILSLSYCSSLTEPGRAPANLNCQLCGIRQPSGTSMVPASMPSGIGLHLNSLTGSLPLSQSSRETDRACGSAASLRSVNAVLEVAPPSGFYGTLADKHVNVGIKQLEETVLSNAPEKKTSPLSHKRVLLPDVPCQTDFNAERKDSGQSPQSLKKKRKSASTAEKSGDVCKRCNCKKSKCLKLYCECFAAGVYCVDSCSCHGCYNKPEFEDKVLETRQQIESRNPLAFAPKIVRALAADLSPTTGEKINGDTPASARHKRGCNCKKSKCLKKYCECYQAGVGCSDGCKCETCQNLYGRKEGSEDSEDNDIQTDKAAEEKMDTSEFCHELTHASQLQHNDLSPITPSFQYTGQHRSMMMSRSVSKRCFSDEELQSSAFLLSSSKPPKSPSWLLRSSKEAQNSFVVPVPSTGRHLSSSPTLNPKILRIGQFSPGWDGLGDICTLTPLPQAPLRPAPASVSIVDGADSSPSFNKQQCNDLSTSGNGFDVKSAMSNNLKLARCSLPTSRHQALHSSINSHHSETPVDLQSTHITPIFNASLCKLDNKSLYDDSKDSCPKFVGFAEDGITPEILKDPEPACSPVCLLKTSSPKQKRVFPHHQGSMEASHQGLQSPGFRSGRKLKLQWIPSVPHTTYSEQVNEKRSKSESRVSMTFHR